MHVFKECHHVMASGRTVRQVKHGERLRRSQNSLAPISTPEKCLGVGNGKKSASTEGIGR